MIDAEDSVGRSSTPEAPAGPWYKDFGSFKICGEGEFPKTFLLKGRRHERKEEGDDGWFNAAP